MTAREDLIGRWVLDREAIAGRIALEVGSVELARRQRAMLDLTEVDFAFCADGTFHWKTAMRLPEGPQEAITRGSWELEGDAVRIALSEQEGGPLIGARERSGRFERGRVTFEDPLLTLILRRRGDDEPQQD